MKIENMENIIELNNKYEATKEIKNILELALNEKVKIEIKLRNSKISHILNTEDLNLIDSKSVQNFLISELLRLSKVKLKAIEEEIQEL